MKNFLQLNDSSKYEIDEGLFSEEEELEEKQEKQSNKRAGLKRRETLEQEDLIKG